MTTEQGSSTSTGSTTIKSGTVEKTSSTAVDVSASGGRTSIADVVVSKIAGIATREVEGVHELGGGATRAIGALRERIPGARVNHSQGVSVEVGESQAAVDLDIVADYGVAMADLASGIRRNVIDAVERMTGLEVTEVNITVHDVYLFEEDGDREETTAARVR